MPTDAQLTDSIRCARGIAYGVARRASAIHLVDELEAAALEGLAAGAVSWKPDADFEFSRWAHFKMRHAAQDALRAWKGRQTPKLEAARWTTGLTNLDHETMPQLGDQQAGEDCTEDWAMAADEMSRLSRAIADLRPQWRDALLYRCRGESGRAVAARHGVTEGRVSQWRALALARIGRTDFAGRRALVGSRGRPA